MKINDLVFGGGFRAAWIMCVAAVLSAATGCGESEEFDYSIIEETDEPLIRVVSLAPALTQMLVDLGQGNLLVGVSQNDMAAPDGVPVVGTYQDINSEKLLGLKPTYVLTMVDKSGVPARLRDLATGGRYTLLEYNTPTTISDVTRILYDPTQGMTTPEEGVVPPTPSLGAVLGLPSAAFALATDIGVRLAQLSAAVAVAEPPRVLMVIGTNPVMASGPGTVHDQLLAFAGGINAAGAATVTAPVYDREKLIELRPDVILILAPGEHPLGPIDSDPRAAAFNGLPIPAVESGRIVLLNDPLVLLPSSSLPRIGEGMAKAIHPELVRQIESALAVSDDAFDDEADTPVELPLLETDGDEPDIPEP